MRILHLCAYLYPALTYGGPAKVVYDLAEEQSKQSDVTILTSDVWDQKRRIYLNEKIRNEKNFKVVYFRNIVNSWAYSLRLFTHASSIIYFLKNYRKFDIVHAHDVFIFPQILILYLCLMFKKPYVITPHGVINAERLKRRSLLKSIFLLISVPLLKRAQKVIAVSDVEEKELESLGLTNVVTIFNGVPLKTHTPSKKFAKYKQPNKLTFLYIGKLHSQKGLIEAIRAVATLKYPFQFLVAGPDDGVESELRTSVDKLSISESVHFIGFVNDAEKAELLHLADLFLYPSYSEGFSISILEALYSKTPALITKGCNFDLVSTHKAGFVVKNSDLEEQLYSVLSQLDTNRKSLQSMGKAAHQLVVSKFSIETMAASHQKIYEAVL